MTRADIYNNIYRDLSGVYVSGAFSLIENKLPGFWTKITAKEEELNVNWDKVTDEQFDFMCRALKKLMLEAILRSRRV